MHGSPPPTPSRPVSGQRRDGATIFSNHCAAVSGIRFDKQLRPVQSRHQCLNSVDNVRPLSAALIIEMIDDDAAVFANGSVVNVHMCQPLLQQPEHRLSAATLGRLPSRSSRMTWSNNESLTTQEVCSINNRAFKTRFAGVNLFNRMGSASSCRRNALRNFLFVLLRQRHGEPAKSA